MLLVISYYLVPQGKLVLCVYLLGSQVIQNQGQAVQFVLLVVAV